MWPTRRQQSLLLWLYSSVRPVLSFEDIWSKGFLAMARENTDLSWPPQCIQEAAGLWSKLKESRSRRQLRHKKHHGNNKLSSRNSPQSASSLVEIAKRYNQQRDKFKTQVALVGLSPLYHSFHTGQAAAIYAQMKTLRFLFGKDVVGAAATFAWTACEEFAETNGSSVSCLAETWDSACRPSALEAMLSADVIVATPMVHWVYKPNPGVKSSYALLRFASENLDKPVWVQNAVFHVHGYHRPSRATADCLPDQENPNSNSEECDAAAALASADWLVTRDQLSADWLRHYAPNVKLAGPAVDLTFLLPSDVDHEARAYLASKQPSTKCGQQDDTSCYSILTVATTLQFAKEGSRHAVVAALVEACALRPTRPVKLVEFRHGMPMHPSDQKLTYSKEVSRLVHSGICADGTETFAYWSQHDSFAQSIRLLKQQDLVVSGSFHITCFARLANVPTVVLPGANTLLNEELVALFRSVQQNRYATDYLAIPKHVLLGADKAPVRNHVKQFFHQPRSSQSDLVAGRLALRNMAFANLAPFFPSCLQAANASAFLDLYFPQTASLQLVIDQEHFVTGQSNWIGWHNCSLHEREQPPGRNVSESCHSNAACFAPFTSASNHIPFR